MVDHNIHRALHVAGIVLLLLYGAGWLMAVRHEHAASAHTAAPAPVEAPLASEGDPGNRVYYRVTTVDGSQHIMDVPALDAAQAVLSASERYGAGASLTRITRAEALARDVAPAATQAPSMAVPLTLWLGVFLLLPLAFLATARTIRRRFQQLDSVYRGVREHLSAPAQRLMEDAAISARELRACLRRINAEKHAELIWDDASGQVVDARLSRLTLSLRYCPRCNTPAAVKVRADLLHVPTCPTCMTRYEGQELLHQQAQIVARLMAESDSMPPPARRRFSCTVFALWTALFPPAALMYAVDSARPG